MSIFPCSRDVTEIGVERFIRNVADFPEAVGGVITLEDDTVYTLAEPVINLGSNRLVSGQNTVIRSLDETVCNLAYLGTEDMITCVDVSLKVNNVTLFSPAANQTFNFTSPTENERNLLIRECFFRTPKLATISNVFTFQMENVAAQDLQSGITFVDQNDDITLMGFVGDITDGIFLDLGSSTLTFMTVANGNLTMSSATFLSGLSNNGNITAGGAAVVEKVDFINPGTTLVGISQEDTQWNIQNVNGLPDSQNAADAYLTATETVTITTAGVYEHIGGVNWSSDIKSRFSSTSDGTITYDGIKNIDVIVSSTATVEKVGGGQDELAVAVAINDVVQDKTTSSTQNNQPTSVPVQGLFVLSNGDTIKLYTANLDGTSDVIVSRATISILG